MALANGPCDLSTPNKGPLADRSSAGVGSGLVAARSSMGAAAECVGQSVAGLVES